MAAASAAAAAGLSVLFCFAVVEAGAAAVVGFWSGSTLACFFEGCGIAVVGVGVGVTASFRTSAFRFLLDCAADSGSSEMGSST